MGFRTEAGFDGLLAKGALWGGNLAMLCSMLGTPHFPRVKGGILFVEDVNEHPYRVERCLLQLHQAGVLGQQKAVLLGAVSDYRASPLDRGYTLKIGGGLRCASVSRTPLVTGLPFGHVRTKVSFPVGTARRARGAGPRRAGRLVTMRRLIALACLSRRWSWLPACNNNPYPSHLVDSNTLFYSFDERSPRYLDPTASYANPESAYTFQIYEPPYGYHYLKRPYELIPKVATEVVRPIYLDKNGERLPDDAPAERIAESVYDVPDPARRHVRAASGVRQGCARALPLPPDHALTRAELGDKRSPWDFEQQGTRELVADDFVYALKRHATTRIEAPVFAVFAEYVIGLKDYGELIKREDAKLLAGLPADVQDKPFLDFRRWPLAGVTALDRYTYRIRLKGKYPQWSYWMAMPFIAPMPWEADAFYAQPGMAEQRPVAEPVAGGHRALHDEHVRARPPARAGAQPQLPRRALPLRRATRRQGGRPAGRLRQAHAVRRPLVRDDREGEGTPRKEKFKQGYLDVPEIERPEWGVDFKADSDDSDEVKRLFEERGFKFPLMTDISNWYLGFNMLDPVVGNTGTPEQRERNRKLRQAISIAIDWEEGYGRIFRHKGGDRRARPDAAGRVRLARADAGFLQPGDAPLGRRQDRAPPDRGREAPAGRGGLSRRPRRRRPAGRWC